MTDATKDKLPTQETVNIFLDELRESGITNMYGATPYIEHSFGVNGEESKQFLVTWMDTFSERHNPEAAHQECEKCGGNLYECDCQS